MTFTVLCYPERGSVLVKIPRTVLFSLLALLVGVACTRPAEEHRAGSATAPGTTTPQHSAVGDDPPVASASPPSTAATTPAPSALAAGAATASSAYFGCGEPIPPARLWDETTESQVLDAISSAKACAAEHGRRLLLEFVAPWCEDCQEMAKLDETAVVAATLQKRFERVRVNVGKWDRHEALRTSFDVRALATYIVLDPKTGKQLAKTTLEPITKKGQKLSAEQWARWLDAH